MDVESEHIYNLKFVRQWHADQEALEEHRLQKLHEAEGTIADVEEANREFAALSGLTLEQFHELLHKHGPLGTEALKALREHPELDSPEAAISFLYRQAGDEAGKEIVDPVGRQMSKRFGSRDLMKATRAEYNATHPRKPRKGKADVIARYERWQAEQNRIRADDVSFDAFMASLQGGEE